MEVTPEEKQEYYEFVAGLLLQRETPPPPDVLWHYTTGETLIRIIESCSLWATQISCLNDHQEFRLATTNFVSALDQYFSLNKLTPDETYFYQRAVKALSVDNAPTNWWYVSCFSAHKDDLSQWRAYSGGEGGYSIGFKTSDLATVAGAGKSYLAPIEYRPNVHSEMANKVAKQSFIFFSKGLSARLGVNRDEWIDAFFQSWSEAITWLAPITKHHKFEAEREWRLVRQLQPNDVPNMKYRQRQMMMSRHVPLNLGFEPKPKKRPILPIAEIIVGPSRHKNISRISVGDLLRTHEYDLTGIKITVSEVPYQTL